MISNLIDHLSSIDSALRVKRIDELGGAWADSAELVYGVLAQQLPGQVYAISRPSVGVGDSSVVYRRVSGKESHIAGFPFLRTDVFVLAYRTKTVEELINLVGGLVSLVEGFADESKARLIEITDINNDYESSGEGNFVCNIELMVTHLSDESQDLPLATVFWDSATASEATSTGKHRQKETQVFTVILVVPNQQLEALQDRVKLGLVGRSISKADVINYVSGRRIEVVGHYSIWSDQYSVSRVITGSN